MEGNRSVSRDIEYYNLDVIRNADHIIDMRPGGGEDGGRVVVCGTVEKVRGCEGSLTGEFL